MGVERTLRPMPAGRARMAMMRKAEEMIRSAPACPAGQSRRREWNQAHGHRVHEGGHHVGHIHGHAVLAVQGGGRFLRQQQGVLQLAHDDLGVDDVQDAHCGVAEGDGDANGQDLPDQMAAAGGDIQGLCPFRCFVKYPTKNSMETAVPAVTPRWPRRRPSPGSCRCAVHTTPAADR